MEALVPPTLWVPHCGAADNVVLWGWSPSFLSTVQQSHDSRLCKNKQRLMSFDSSVMVRKQNTISWVDACAAHSGMFSFFVRSPPHFRQKWKSSFWVCAAKGTSSVHFSLTDLMLVDNSSVVLKRSLPCSPFRRKRASMQTTFKAHSPDQHRARQHHLVIVVSYQLLFLINKMLSFSHSNESHLVH